MRRRGGRRRDRCRTGRSATCGHRRPRSRHARHRPSESSWWREALAHRPNAPSTWTQTSSARIESHTAPTESNAPEFTFPAWVQTIAGPSTSGSAATHIRPWSSAGTRMTRSRPRPSMPSALNRVAWACSPATTVISGAPWSPCRSTSWPCASSTERRAAASAVKLAIVAPVTKAAAPSDGRSSASSTHRSAIRSIAAPIGELTSLNAFWSHAAASQVAASDAGRVPPVTKPK